VQPCIPAQEPLHSVLRGWESLKGKFYSFQKKVSTWACLVHTYNPSTWEAEAGRL
jgi:hypothetical protein